MIINSINTDTSSIEEIEKQQNDIVEFLEVFEEPVAADIVRDMIKKTSELSKVSDIKTVSGKSEDYLKSISETNTLIFNELKSIRENMIDEQDTSIKKVSAPQVINKSEQVNIIPKNSDSWSFLGDLGKYGLFGTLGLLFKKYGGKLLGKLLGKNVMKFLGEITSKGIINTIGGYLGKAIKSLSRTMLKTIFSRLFAVWGAAEAGLWIGDEINKYFGDPTFSETLAKAGGIAGLLNQTVDGILINVGLGEIADKLHKAGGLSEFMYKEVKSIAKNVGLGYFFDNTEEEKLKGKETVKSINKNYNADSFKTAKVKEKFENDLEDNNIVSFSIFGDSGTIIMPDIVQELQSKQIKYLQTKYTWNIDDQKFLMRSFHIARKREEAIKKISDASNQIDIEKPGDDKVNNIARKREEAINNISDASNQIDIEKPNNDKVKAISEKTPTVKNVVLPFSKSINTTDIFKLNGNPDVNSLDKNVQFNLKNLGIEYYNTFGEKMQINSAFRSIKEQEELNKKDPNKAAAPGASMHNYGVAIDINSSDLEKANSIGLLSKYNFTLPAYTKSGKHETWHLEPEGIDRAGIRSQGIKNYKDSKKVSSKSDDKENGNKKEQNKNESKIKSLKDGLKNLERQKEKNGSTRFDSVINSIKKEIAILSPDSNKDMKENKTKENNKLLVDNKKNYDKRGINSGSTNTNSMAVINNQKDENYKTSDLFKVRT